MDSRPKPIHRERVIDGPLGLLALWLAEVSAEAAAGAAQPAATPRLRRVATPLRAQERTAPAKVG